MRFSVKTVASLFFAITLIGSSVLAINLQEKRDLTVFERQSSRPAIPVLARTLHTESTHPLGVPQFGYFGQAHVDSSHNLYFAVGSGADLRRAVILEIKRSKGEPILHRLKDGSGDFVQFAVTPSGSVNILSVTAKDEYAITDFDSDGSPKGMTSTQVSKRIQITDFLAFDDGEFFVGGYYREAEGTKKAGSNYLALLDSSGRIVRSFGIESADVDTTFLVTHLFDGASSIGPDGNIYVVRGERISILNRTGKVIERFSYTKPDPDFVARRIERTGRLIVLWLRKTPRQGTDQVQFLLIDASSHEPYALYTPDQKLGTNAMYYEDEEGFSFLGVEDGRVTLVNAREE